MISNRKQWSVASVIALTLVSSLAWANPSNEFQGAEMNGPKPDDKPVVGKPGLGKPGQCVPGLRISKSGPRKVKIKERFRYTIRLTNTGTCDLSDIRVSDQLPRRAKFLNAYPSPDRSPFFEDYDDEVIWDRIHLAAGASKTFNIRVRTKDFKSKEDRKFFTLVNRACAESSFLRFPICDSTRTRVFFKEKKSPRIEVPQPTTTVTGNQGTEDEAENEDDIDDLNEDDNSSFDDLEDEDWEN